MSINVSYKKIYGYMYLLSNDDKKYIKATIHPSNCLLATVYHFKENGKKYVSLVNFFSDLKHLKNCFDPNDPIYKKNELKKVILFDDLPNFEKIAKVIVKGGFTVEIKHAK